MIPAAGEQFGPYEILGTLGRGGVGEVYRAWDGRLEREVALKVLHDEYPQQGNRERFMIEARAASALNHASICTVFDIGQKDGSPYLVMELLKGETLKQRIERGGIPSEEIAQFGIEIAEALGAAHALGIVHRDIKPANVMLVRQPDGRCRVKVLDFGLAKLTGPLPGRLTHHDEHLTVVGEAVGTVSYMSPEQARGEELDGRSDLFSLGVVMYEMATRRTPFHGSTTALLFAQLLGQDPEPIHNWNDSVPRPLEKVILKLLEKEPGRRLQSASELGCALHSVALKASGTRWRRPSAPAVPLVRVDEPVARAVLPSRPDFRHEEGVVSLGLDPRGHHLSGKDPAGGSSGHKARLATAAPEIARIEVSPSRSRSRGGEGNRVDAAHAHPSPAPFQGSSAVHPPANSSGPRRSSAAHAFAVETRVEPLPTAIEENVPVLRPAADKGSGSSAGGHVLRVPVAVAEAKEAAPKTLRRRALLVRGGVAAAAVVVLTGAFAGTRLTHRPVPLLAPSDFLLVTEIENDTDVQTLDAGVAAGIEFALAQTPDLSVRGIGSYRAAIHSMGADGRPSSAMQARQAAQAAGAKAYVYGQVREGEEGAHSSGAGYTLSVAVIETATSRELARADANAARIGEIPGAIDEVAATIRRTLLGKQPGGGSSVNGVPVAREATGSLNALRAYAAGARAEAEGRPMAALKAYGIAAAADPNFVQALVRISWLAGEQDADDRSAEAATRARSSAAARSGRTALVAEIAYEVNAERDMPAAEAAVRRLAGDQSRDPEALLALARVLRLEGRYSEALNTAQKGLALEGNNSGLFREAELALLSLDRYGDVLSLEAKASALGLYHPGITLSAAFLGGRGDRLAAAAANIRDEVAAPETLAADAAYLDNTGELTAGASAWRDAADSVRGQPTLAGADAVLLGRAALDRALVGDCTFAVGLARNAVSSPGSSVDSGFAGGIAGALCGDRMVAQAALATLSADRAQALQGHVLRAATALAEGNSDLALGELGATHNFDPTLILPYVRGLAHLEADAPAAAVADFQEVLAHRGAALAGGTDVYPAAQLALSRALAMAGDHLGSQQARNHFLQLWTGANAADRLRADAEWTGGVLPAQRPFLVPAESRPQLTAVSTQVRAKTRAGATFLSHKQMSSPERALPSAWPDRPARTPSYPQERKYGNIRESDLE